ncbi:unnamed protein product [Rangifer tarandus platyrhynchus]|uniref:Uncharacterized protein n=1 Tax=Rangifer tarandus platyrhynchus TaxID=3082113 RepID=A0ABN8ZAJ5_RANTA|nr:unnamed protein product [Rangifer tarandus platyrhynchus]CAI9689238.1 unnamed protein product [Rangifer tarandus platyrhynchus]
MPPLALWSRERGAGCRCAGNSAPSSGRKPRSVKRPPLRPFRGRMRSRAQVPHVFAPGPSSEEDRFSKDTGVRSGFRMIHMHCIYRAR